MVDLDTPVIVWVYLSQIRRLMPFAASSPLPPTPAAILMAASGESTAPIAFAEAVELFIGRTKRTKSGSPNTGSAYRNDLRNFKSFLAARSIKLGDVRRREAEAYITMLSAEVSARTIRRRVSTLCSFFKFLLAIEAVARNPFVAHDLPSFDPKSETSKVLTTEQLERAVSLLSTDVAQAHRALEKAKGAKRLRAFSALFVAARRRAMFTLMAFAALRRAGVTGLTRDAITSRPDGYALSFRSKGDKKRIVPLVGFAYPALFDWLTVRREIPTLAPQVFVTLNGKGIGKTQVERDCKAIGKRIKCSFTLTPHVLRRTCATRSLEASGDIRAVQELLGHTSIETTQYYTHVAPETLRKLVEMPGFASTFGPREHARGPLVRSAS